MYRILLGALVGSMSILFLFLPLSSLTLFLLKLLVSIFMILVTFGYKNISSFKKNFFYFYILSIMLGGIIYFLDITFSYKNTGLIFFNNGLSINFIVLLIIGPIILFLYIKEQKEYKKNYTLIHTVEVKIKNKKYTYRAYLDTGNKLEDPYKKRAILLVYDKKLGFNYNDSILVPYQTIDGTGVLKCHKVDSIKIDNIEIKNKVNDFNVESLEAHSDKYIKDIYEFTNHNIKETSKILGISRSTLWRKLNLFQNATRVSKLNINVSK